MKRHTQVLIFILILLFTCCDSSTTTPEKPGNSEPAEQKTKEPAKFPYREIDIPGQEHGYSNFDTTVLRTRKELNRFMAKHTGKLKGWNKFDEFKHALEQAQIDFDEEVLLLIRDDATTGNVNVQFAPRIEDDRLVIRVDRKGRSDVGPEVMQYFAYAVAVDTERLHTVRIEIDGQQQRTLSIK